MRIEKNGCILRTMNTGHQLNNVNVWQLRSIWLSSVGTERHKVTHLSVRRVSVEVNLPRSAGKQA